MPCGGKGEGGKEYVISRGWGPGMIGRRTLLTQCDHSLWLCVQFSTVLMYDGVIIGYYSSVLAIQPLQWRVGGRYGETVVHSEMGRCGKP